MQLWLLSVLQKHHLTCQNVYLVSKGIMADKDFPVSGHYRWHTVEGEFETCTYSNAIYDQEVVLTTTVERSNHMKNAWIPTELQKIIQKWIFCHNSI